MTDVTIDDLIGKLSDRRCPECGRCLYVNPLGDAWCGVQRCQWRGRANEAVVRVPIPTDVDGRGLPGDMTGYAAEGS